MKRRKAGECVWCSRALYHASRQHPTKHWHIGSAGKVICFRCTLSLASTVLDAMQRDYRKIRTLLEADEFRQTALGASQADPALDPPCRE